MFQDLLGKPFINHGRKDGFDCYGLAIEVSRRLGHKLYDLDYNQSTEDTFFRNVDGMLQRKIEEDLLEVTTAKFGDLILFADGKGRMVHIGVKLDGDDFIHCDKYGVRIAQLDTYYRKNRRFFTWQN